MRFDLLSGGIFWGAILILLGISIIVKIVFNVNLHLFKIIFALFLIFLGIKMLTGFSLFDKIKQGVMFNSQKVSCSEYSKEYNTIFGKGIYDFSKLSITNSDVKVEVNTIFAGGEIILNPEIPTIVLVQSTFSGAKLPDGSIISFGNAVYKTKSYKEGSPTLIIDAAVVFGGLEVFENGRH